jgi:hypothetical protein
MAVSVDKLWQNIMYCNFIIKSVVSESAILTFCIDVLSMMGLLTADDLGKRLNEASKVPQVMVTLKEQVGGLKEFLKRFPDVFIFSYEHPYNPHVFLRISLTPELQAEVENGVLPVKLLSHIIAKVRELSFVFPHSLPNYHRSLRVTPFSLSRCSLAASLRLRPRWTPPPCAAGR